MELTIENTSPDIATAVLRGDFDAIGSKGVKQQFTQLASSDIAGVELDLSEVNFLDSSGIGAIVYLYKRLIERNKTLEISNIELGSQPHKLMMMLRVDKVIKLNSKQV